ncbi:lipoyltransferase [Mycoplasmopsis pullorum]|uniref:lipoate--protein ligase n=2 Tax=Mycoplasmopsis pullorum TaxID=48003 RepID=UPI00111962C3|nr:lipoate--protein ligase [Mycoplasmopsis pullorum]TNK92097.1 lipoyltransferase [Mycoplasmopsis pullorum]
MKIYRVKETSPYITLSYEELITKDPEMSGDILMIYQHDNAVIIGKNQNAYEEIKRDYVEANKIELARRISGGGAVYHDLGNINFSFITDYDKKGGYERFLKPIIDFLNSLGLNAVFHGRNDLLCNGAKISGNAQFIHKNRIVSHGTLLFDVDLSKLSNALNPSKLKIQSKGIQSIRQRVTNIAKELNYSMKVDEFIDRLIKFFVENYEASYEEIPTQKYTKQLKELSDIRKSHEWIYGKNPNFMAENVDKFVGGIIKVKYTVENDKFKDFAFEGDFLSKKNVEEVSELIIGKNYDREEFLDFLNKLNDSNNFEEYFGSLKPEEIANLVFGK